MLTIQKERPSTTLPGLSSFLYFIVFLLAFLASAPTAIAETYSVSNDSEVPVRSGQGTEYKIVSLLQNGEPVDSLEENGYWIKIRTSTGREGWMLKRYLASSPSVDDAFSLPVNSNRPETQTKKNNSTAEHQPIPPQPETNFLPDDIQLPQADTSIAPQIGQQQKERENEIKELRDKLAEVTMENQALRKDERIQWFLAGGGVLVIGWLIGLITCRSRRRKPSLL
ncbi:MAG: TIGR04211 family SH3 domain-containing protein [Proteobacteria bacterium]|nr:TIGR04211 family SH3 domain-containing protein [Pseudomonadota bacterium]MBU1648889.1 TIGR04211 family SH3 domain-containing protein [Pseudomonadota bacterium]MBU1986678.1 TIGR04211 family SH3 domain-containing protein [Pseudomonadota bacterium]